MTNNLAKRMFCNELFFTTSISYLAKTSRRGMSEEEAGITMGLLRISVGLESIEDVIAEFDKALNNI